MSELLYSFVIPVYNRPFEVEELLSSFTKLEGQIPFEIIIVEDGSDADSEKVVQAFKQRLNIRYFKKANSGPGDSRNFGMARAQADYFIILDSDVILHPKYLIEVDAFLKINRVDCFGGPDGATDQFTPLQQAINFSMTSLWTTGGVRGHNKNKDFQPRSFNMGISKAAFFKTGGFGRIHPGEDPDLVFRLWDSGFKTTFIQNALVYHKRRISWKLFIKQVYKFGSVRPILNRWHPVYKKMTFWFPSLFLLGALGAIGLMMQGINYLMYLYLLYFFLVFTNAIVTTKSVKISVLSLYAVLLQFFGYGYGFLRSSFYLSLYSNRPAEELFPNLFFK